MTFQIVSALSTELPESAVPHAIEEIRRSLDGSIDFAVVFFSEHFSESVAQWSALLRRELSPQVLLGCQGESIVGSAREVEQGPALSLWAAQLPGVQMHPLELKLERTAEGGVIAGWPDSLASSWPSPSTMILLGDPFTFPADMLLARMAEDQPQCVVAGGMASGAASPGQLRMLLDDRVLEEGAAAVLLDEKVELRCVVSQGCRPIGQPMVVTKADGNLLLELGGHPAMQQLEAIFHALPNREQAMAQRGLHVGRVINEYQEIFAAGDFLIRNVVGIDPESGSVAAGDSFRVGQTVQFHLRDQESADRELRQLLQKASEQGPAAGGLLFTCNGRGTQMFSEKHHDAAAVAACFSDLPLAGLFAQGEIGPVGGRSFIHGFTACLALFQEAVDKC